MGVGQERFVAKKEHTRPILALPPASEPPGAGAAAAIEVVPAPVCGSTWKLVAKKKQSHARQTEGTSA